ncbi:uncharacterized protein LOC128864873 [Anastrepha ludens]|uniref:uncharacterized protein LOC128864873 n=1 Tax=Anastrepha ludens TaxID=28586 RepID=UPI0023B1FFA8|nr:uncharacterized protein LOC128864873 [Anastrepha ludens]
MSQPSSRRISPPHFRRAFVVPGTATQIGAAPAEATADAKMKTTNIVDVNCYQTVATSPVSTTTTTTTTTASIAHLSGSAEGCVITSTIPRSPPVNSDSNTNSNISSHISVANIRAGGMGGAGGRNMPSSCPDSPIRRVSSSLKNSALGFASRFFNKCKAATFTVDGATFTIGKWNAHIHIQVLN